MNAMEGGSSKGCDRGTLAEIRLVFHSYIATSFSSIEEYTEKVQFTNCIRSFNRIELKVQLMSK